MKYKVKLGAAGEEFAASTLKNLGYEIVDRNYRTGHGEIDIVAKCDNELRFVEVKTRMGHRYGYPAEAINYDKQTRMKACALEYIADKGLRSVNIYLDVFELEANYIKDCV